MVRRNLLWSMWLISLVFISSCGKEEFATPKVRDQQSTGPIVYKTTDLCTGHSLVKPKVDFLFLWDNSSSQLFVTAATKQALNNTINYISGQFDYHVLLAPLMKSTGTDQMYLVVDNETGLSTAAKSLVVPQNTATDVINFPFVGGAREDGAARVIQLIQDNIANGIFRSKANTIVVLMSNGDDNSFVPAGGIITGVDRDNYINQKVNELSTLSNSTLNAAVFRFISLVAFSVCGTGYQENYVYKNLAKNVYGNYLAKLPASSLSTGNDQKDKTWPDSYDICATDFAHLFDGINNSITAVLVGHAYDYWPIGNNTEPDFDPGHIQAKKKYANVELIQNEPNGFTYVGYRENQNTRYLPEPGEPYTGLLIKLNGTGVVQYPECLIVTTQTPAR